MELSLSTASVTLAVCPSTRSALVATVRVLVQRRTSGRVSASANADTTMNTPACTMTPASSMAATMAATAPATNHTEISPAVMASRMPNTTAAPSQIQIIYSMRMLTSLSL